MKWANGYPHERSWKPTDTTRDATPLPEPDKALQEAMRYYLESRQLSYECAVEKGSWYAAYYRGPRIIIPCLRSDGKKPWWQGRLIDTLRNSREKLQFEMKRWDGARGYRGDAVCYISADFSRPVLIVEGPMDALAAASCGFPAIAVLGSMPPQLVFDQVVRLVETSYRKGSCFIVPDADRLGDWANTQAQLGARGVYGSIQQLPGGFKDLAEMPQPERQEFLDGITT